MKGMRRIAGLAMLACIAAIGACRAASQTPERPAVLSAPTPQVISTLAHTVSKALGGRHVLLAPGALTRSSELIVEPAVHRGLQGRLDGRTRGRPDKFHLVMRGSKCILVRDKDGHRFELTGARCKPAS